jgi:hypothetical protein
MDNTRSNIYGSFVDLYWMAAALKLVPACPVSTKVGELELYLRFRHFRSALADRMQTVTGWRVLPFLVTHG